MEETTKMQEVTNSLSIPSQNMTILEKGKIPPQDMALEEAVIGGMLIDKKGVDDVIDILSKDTFYSPTSKIHNLLIYLQL